MTLFKKSLRNRLRILKFKTEAEVPCLTMENYTHLHRLIDDNLEMTDMFLEKWHYKPQHAYQHKVLQTLEDQRERFVKELQKIPVCQFTPQFQAQTDLDFSLASI